MNVEQAREIIYATRQQQRHKYKICIKEDVEIRVMM